MNREWVLNNLLETIEHINSAVREVEEDNQDGFETWMPFIYRDLNRAWNGRHLDRLEIAKIMADETLCRFPTDLDVAD